MSCKKDLRRLDATGQAKRGSQRQIQFLVNSRQEEFSKQILGLLSLPPLVEAKVQWVSPLAEYGFNEYQDAEFLEKLELNQHSPRLKDFWPPGGPCWDAPGVVRGINPQGAVLIEAKSHFSEMQSTCRGRGTSRQKIEKSLALTARSLGVEMNSSWTDQYYQIANRYAHLYFLREVAEVRAWLVNVYFINDQSIEHVQPPPRSADEWHEELRRVRERMGLGTKPVPITADLFMEAVST